MKIYFFSCYFKPLANVAVTQKQFVAQSAALNRVTSKGYVRSFVLKPDTQTQDESVKT